MDGVFGALPMLCDLPDRKSPKALPVVAVVNWYTHRPGLATWYDDPYR